MIETNEDLGVHMESNYEKLRHGRHRVWHKYTGDEKTDILGIEIHYFGGIRHGTTKIWNDKGVLGVHQEYRYGELIRDFLAEKAKCTPTQ